MYEERDDGGGGFQGLDPGCGPRILLAVVVVIVAVLGVLWLAGEWEGHRADREMAEVSRIEALTARDREANLHREYMFQSWTVALAAFSSRDQGSLVVVAALLGAAVAVIVIRWWESIQR